MTTALLMGLGLILLVFGSDSLVRGSTFLATRWGVPKLFIGLTIVAFGTSAPELVVSVVAAFQNHSDVALGNVVGSNVFNILFILGICALIRPLAISNRLIWLEVPLMIFAVLLLFLLGQVGKLDKWVGMFFILCLFAYTFLGIKVNRIMIDDMGPEISESLYVGPLKISLLIVLGLAGLVLGSHLFVLGAVGLGRSLGVNEWVIGVTIVSAGTSLPELATSIMASVKGQRDIAVGNVVGSNIFNIFGVLGFTCLVSPNELPLEPATLFFDLPFLLGASFACLPIMLTQSKLSRLEGAVLLVGYGVYIAFVLFRG